VVLLEEVPVIMATVEAEVGEEVEEAEVEVGLVVEIGAGGEVVVLEAATAAVEVGDPLAVALADVAGITSASGRRTFQLFSPLNSRS